MKNNNKMRHHMARRLSLLALCIATAAMSSVHAEANDSQELTLFATLSGQDTPASPAAPVVKSAIPAQPFVAAGVSPASASHTAGITAATLPSHSASPTVPPRTAAPERAPSGGGFLTEEQRRPAPFRRVAVANKPVSSAPPASALSQTPTLVSATAAAPPKETARQATPASQGAQISLYGRATDTVMEDELRRQFLSAARIAWRINPVLKSYLAQGEAAEASVDEAKGQRWPQVDVNASSATKEFGGGVKNYENQSNIPALSVSVATNLIDFGQTRHTIESREERVTSAQYKVQAQREELAMQVNNALIEWAKQQHIIDISKQYMARMTELVNMLSGIVQSDAGRRSELTQAKGRLLQARSYLESAESRARDVEITLNRLLGGNRVALPASDKWLLAPGALQHQLKQLDVHPVILYASAETRAAEKEAEAISASGLPKLNWTVSKNTREDDLGRQQAWQTGLNVSWPLFRGGSVRAQELASRKQADASRQQQEEQRRDLENKVRAANQDAFSMAERATLYKGLTVESDRIRKDFYDQWYHLGRRTLLDVLSAESDLYNNQVSEISNRFDSFSAVIRGYSSAGMLSRWLTQGANQNV